MYKSLHMTTFPHSSIYTHFDIPRCIIFRKYLGPSQRPLKQHRTQDNINFAFLLRIPQITYKITNDMFLLKQLLTCFPVIILNLIIFQQKKQLKGNKNSKQKSSLSTAPAKADGLSG